MVSKISNIIYIYIDICIRINIYIYILRTFSICHYTNRCSRLKQIQPELLGPEVRLTMVCPVIKTQPPTGRLPSSCSPKSSPQLPYKTHIWWGRAPHSTHMFHFNETKRGYSMELPLETTWTRSDLCFNFNLLLSKWEMQIKQLQHVVFCHSFQVPHTQKKPKTFNEVNIFPTLVGGLIGLCHGFPIHLAIETKDLFPWDEGIQPLGFLDCLPPHPWLPMGPGGWGVEAGGEANLHGEQRKNGTLRIPGGWLLRGFIKNFWRGIIFGWFCLSVFFWG